MNDELHGSYGRPISELGQGAIRRDLRRLEDARLRRRGLLAKPQERRKSFRDGDAVRLAFARAEREQRELARLKATGRPFACLDFRPERLTVDP